MATVVRINYSGGNIDFTEREIGGITRQYVQSVDRYRDQDNYVRQKFNSKGYNVIFINFKIKTQGVIATDLLNKLSTIYNALDTYKQAEVIRIYYKYLISTGTSIYAQLDRNTYRKNYYKSLIKLEAIQMKFIETNTP